MPIYTRTGDKGTTSLYNGKRILKSDKQIDAYGTVDELTSLIGLVVVKIKNKNDKQFLTAIQRDLYKIMSVFSGSKMSLDNLINKVSQFEDKIDELDKKLPKLNKFIIPGGTEVSSWLHVIRAVCRRAERLIVKLEEDSYTVVIIRYLNRLSDLFFVLARFYNRKKEILV